MVKTAEQVRGEQHQQRKCTKVLCNTSVNGCKSTRVLCSTSFSIREYRGSVRNRNKLSSTVLCSTNWSCHTLLAKRDGSTVNASGTEGQGIISPHLFHHPLHALLLHLISDGS